MPHPDYYSDEVADVSATNERLGVLTLLSLLRVGDPIFLLCAWSGAIEGLGLVGHVEIPFAVLRDGGIITLRVFFDSDPDLVEFALGPVDEKLRTERGMCYTLAGVPAVILKGLKIEN